MPRPRFHLDRAVQPIEVIAMPYGTAYLAQHPTGSDPRYADWLGKPHGENIALEWAGR